MMLSILNKSCLGERFLEMVPSVPTLLLLNFYRLFIKGYRVFSVKEKKINMTSSQIATGKSSDEIMFLVKFLRYSAVIVTMKILFKRYSN